MTDEKHIKKSNDYYQVVFKRYKINRSFDNLEDAIAYRNKIEENITKQDLQKIVDKDYKLMFPNNVLDVIYKTVDDEEFKNLDFAWIYDNAPENILNVLGKINSEKGNAIFMQHVTGLSFEKIASNYGITRQRAQQVFASILDKVVAYKNYILYPVYYTDYAKLETEYKVKYEKLKARLENLNQGRIENDEECVYASDAIEGLDLSPRTYRCLKKAGYKTISELVLLDEEQFMHIRGFGKKCFKEIKGKLRCFQYELED